MSLDKPAFVAFVTTLSLICATIPCAAMGRNLAKFSPAPHSLSRLAAAEQMLAADVEKLRSHLRHGADESQIALERALIYRDWENIVAERGSKTSRAFVPTHNLPPVLAILFFPGYQKEHGLNPAL